MAGKKKSGAVSTSGIAAKVNEIISGKITELGYILWDLEYKKEGASYTLEVTIDKDGGVSIDDCENVTRAINPLLDEADPIQDAYYLEVSSAGIDRVLKNELHFKRYIGKPVEIRFYAPDENGMKSDSGTLLSFDEASVSIMTAQGERTILLEKIAQIKTIDENEEL